MYGYMWLGAWLLTLLIVGILVISTGLPDNGTGEDTGEFSIAWFGKLVYLIAVAATFYAMGAHFNG